MGTIDVDNSLRKNPEFDDSMYKNGKFKYRTKTDVCKKFSGVCPVNRKQKDPEYDVCNEFCIPARDDKKRSP